MATHRFHKNDDSNNLYGIHQTELVRGLHLTDNKDLLNSGKVDEGKALASIPSIFARPRFVEIAFTHCEFDGEHESTYDKVVSKTLDLLEGLFHSKKGDYEFKPFYFEDQIKKLQNSKFEGHKLLSCVLERERSNMGCVDVIFLIEKKEETEVKFLGGTSPFSFVYPSPDFVGNAAVKGLTSRSESFRLFMYRYYCAMLQENKADTSFWAFVEKSMAVDENILDGQKKPKPGSYSFNNLIADYEGVSCDDNGVEVPVVACSFLPILHRKPADFTSQLFILSTRQDVLNAFNKITSPIILPTQDTKLYVCEQNSYKSTDLRNKEHWDAKNDDQVRDIPGQEPQHRWVSAIDFFEDDLLVYPASIKESAFIGTYKIDADKFVLPPLRTLFFKYFTINDIKDDSKNKMLHYESTKGGIKVILEIPVCDENKKETGKVIVYKNYPMPDIKEEPAFNVAISPFCHIGVAKVNPVLNSHYVMLLHSLACEDASSQNLVFYDGARELKSAGHERTTRKGNAEGTTYYKVDDFDNVEITIGKCRGRLIPSFDEVSSNGAEIYYAVDFGTTNTHIAYHSGKDKHSFSSEDLNKQVVYFSDACCPQIVNVEFFPSFPSNSSEYKFPISSAVGFKSGVNDGELFSYSSIGFRYLRSLLPDETAEYMTDLKWNMTSTGDLTKGKGRLFLSQIMWMIKNHWLLNDKSSSVPGNSPKIVFTFPLTDGVGSGMKASLMNEWEKIYKDTFGLNAVPTGYLVDMSESIAPCEGIPTSKTTKGVLNIDIGGGTTDIQYIFGKNYQYMSVRFAADDIWGDGFEHCGSVSFDQDRIDNRAKNRYRKNQFFVPKDADLDDFTTTELMNYNFKENFNDVQTELKKSSNEELRLPMFIHYAAIMYHIARWLKIYSNNKIPQYVQFSGMGSGYIKFLFSEHKNLEFFTKELIHQYWGDDSIKDLEIGELTDVTSAKCKTAEGAAVALYKSNNNKPVVMTSNLGSFVGVGDKKKYSPKEYSDDMLDSCIASIKDELKKLIDGYNTAVDAYQEQYPPYSKEVYSIDENRKESFLKNAEKSFESIFNDRKSEIQKTGITESILVWALKNSLWQI